MIDGALQEDPAVSTLMKGIATLLNPKQQTSTLIQDYRNLYQESGLDKINEELIDAETVINGTEDDIRREIQTAGGFGTESQVQALALSRNKSLLVRYNQLAQMKTDATNQLNTMMQLTQQDRQLAQQKVNTQINAMFQMADFRQKATNNVREAFNNLVTHAGYDGAFAAYSNNPNQLRYIESISGIATGGLSQLAAKAQQERAREQAIEAEKLGFERQRVAFEGQRVGLEAQRVKLEQRRVALSEAELTEKLQANEPITIEAQTLDELPTALAGIIRNQNVPAEVRNQMRKGQVLLNKLAEMIRENPEGNFAGGRVRSVFAPLLPASAEPRFQKLKSDEANLRQNFVNYITGAAYTNLQEKDTNQIIPRSQLFDSQNQQRVQNMANTILGDMQAALSVSGINVTLPQFDDVFTSQLMSGLSPEQEAELRDEGLIK